MVVHVLRSVPNARDAGLCRVPTWRRQRAIPNPEVQEFETFDNPLVHSIFNEPFTLVDGSLILPDAPGLGYTLNEATIERFRVA